MNDGYFVRLKYEKKHLIISPSIPPNFSCKTKNAVVFKDSFQIAKCLIRYPLNVKN